MKKERPIIAFLVLLLVVLGYMFLHSGYIYTYVVKDVHSSNQSAPAQVQVAPAQQYGDLQSHGDDDDQTRKSKLMQSDNKDSFPETDDLQHPANARKAYVMQHKSSDCHKELVNRSDWSFPKVPEPLQNVQQDNTNLSEHICKEWLLPPFTTPRKLAHAERTHYSQRDQSMFVDGLLKQRRDGFYIESGAADGEGLSNSLFFEKSRNWTGLLVEANPKSFASILKKSRHAYMVNSCLSPTNKPMVIPFRLAGYIGGLTNYMEDTHKRRIDNHFKGNETINIQCFPLFSILQAMGISHVDYFSLDIEGAEFEVLKTLPLDQITVDVFSIEYVISSNGKATKEKLKAIREYLVDQYDYQIVRLFGEDVILMKKQ